MQQIYYLMVSFLKLLTNGNSDIIIDFNNRHDVQCAKIDFIKVGLLCIFSKLI